jgi:hypothetical protein
MLTNDNLAPILEAFDYYMKEYEEAKVEADELMKRGNRLDEASRRIPGMAGYRFAQLQEIEQLLNFLENRENRLLGVKRRTYKEHYPRIMNDSMIEKYAETDPELLDLAEIRNLFALVRNKFLSITKQHEYIHYQINNLTKLREKGIITEEGLV